MLTTCYNVIVMILNVYMTVPQQPEFYAVCMKSTLTYQTFKMVTFSLYPIYHE